MAAQQFLSGAKANGAGSDDEYFGRRHTIVL